MTLSFYETWLSMPMATPVPMALLTPSSRPGTALTESHLKQEGLLTIDMFIGEPVVLRVLILKVRIPLPALLLSEVFKVLRAILSVAELELVAWPYARTASVGRTAEEGKQWLVWPLMPEQSIYQIL